MALAFLISITLQMFGRLIAGSLACWDVLFFVRTGTMFKVAYISDN